MTSHTNMTSHTRTNTALCGVLIVCVTGCAALAGIEEKRCEPGCVDATTRLVCVDETTAAAESCPTSEEVCAAPSCNAGVCGFRPAIGKSCGHKGRGHCNEGFACLGPELKIAAIRNHTCLVADDGKIWCWGSNAKRQLGDGTLSDRGNPVLVKNLPLPATDVSVGYEHTCAILTDGQIYCWGENTHGQCGGAGPSQPLPDPTLVPMPGLAFIQVYPGARHTCALADDRTVYCWGDTTGGQCGVDPAVAGVTTVGPTRVPHFDPATDDEPKYLDQVSDVETVKAHTCARRATPPTMVCWGSNTYYDRLTRSHALGPKAKDVAYSARPVVVDLGADVIDIGMGFESTYAVTFDNRVFAWGWNERRQLGVESAELFVTEPSPVLMDLGPGPEPLTGATEVLRTDGSHQCARISGELDPGTATTHGTPYLCWGANDYGEVGVGESSLGHQIFRFGTPARTLPSSTRRLVTGEDHACAITSADGYTDVLCYGFGAWVGNGSTMSDSQAQWQAKPVVWDPANFKPEPKR